MMTSYLGLVQQGLFFGFLITAITALVLRITFPFFNPILKRQHPATRANNLLLIIVLPILLAFTVISLALLPSVLQLLGLSSDHYLVCSFYCCFYQRFLVLRGIFGHQSNFRKLWRVILILPMPMALCF